MKDICGKNYWDREGGKHLANETLRKFGLWEGEPGGGETISRKEDTPSERVCSHGE